MRATPEAQAAIQRLGKRVRALRLERGLTQERLAAAAQLDPKHVTAIEAGQSNATIATLTGLAIGLRVPMWQLFRAASGSSRK